MNTLKNLLPLSAAIISALALLAGYGYQKSLERDAEIRKTRQEIYSRLISNITQRNTMLGRLLLRPEYMKARPEERPQLELKDAALAKNEGERTEIVASLCLYGTDEAVDAYTKYARANAEGKGGDLGELILSLRRSIYRTHINANEADLAIWNDPKYLNQ